MNKHRPATLQWLPEIYKTTLSKQSINMEFVKLIFFQLKLRGNDPKTKNRTYKRKDKTNEK